jgi:excinuclease ABC subunit C
MVVFEDGRPARHAYRRFRIKAGDQNDDFASMYEVIGRRFRRAAQPPEPGDPSADGTATDAVLNGVEAPLADGAALDAGEEARDVAAEDAAVAERTGDVPADAGEAGLMATEEAGEGDGAGPAAAGGEGDRGGWTILPELVIIDGGKGQLGAALEAMRDVGAPPLTVVGLAKEREEVFRPGYAEPLLLPRTSQALYLIQRIRDEAHRFAVTYHRLVRNKRMVTSKLDGVSGIGPKRKKALLQRFGSVSGIREASDEELLTVSGINDSILAQLREQL